MVSWLRSADLRAIVELVGEMDELDSEEAFPAHLLGRLGAICGGELVAFNERDVVANELVAESVWCAEGPIEPDDDWVDPTGVDAWQFVRYHPVNVHRRRTGYVGVLGLSDFYTRRARVRHDIFGPEYHAYWNVVDTMGVSLSASPTRTTRLWLESSGPDFRARDRAVLDVLQPHLAARRRRARVQRVLRGALSVLEMRPDDRDATAVLLVGPGGSLEFASRPALELLARYFGEATAQLPGTLEEWRRAASGSPLAVRRDGNRLVVDVVGPGRSALVLHEESASAAALTPREWEVMRCVAAGKKNDEIAELLWITPGTVKKHLEHVFAKLGVRTRTAALATLRPRLASGSNPDSDAAAEH